MEPSRHILVIEDDPMNNRLLTTVLQRLGYIADAAFDGLSGLAKVESNPPDLILLDLDLPGMDGYEVETIGQDQDHSDRRGFVLF
jgi:CheY-like chemotaxis protein